MEPLVTILARRNSQGLPHKNVRLLNGVPLIEHSIRHAKEWGKGPIVVSSDDPEVKRIATKHSLYFIQRPKKLATSRAGKIESIRHAWRWAERKMKNQFDLVLDLDCCNPLRRIQDIEAVWKIMFESAPMPLSVFSVTRARRHPAFNMWPRTTEGILNLTRQETPEMFDINSNVYGYSREFMLSDRQHPITERSEVYVMPEWSFCDIDSEMDFGITRHLMEEYAEELGKAPY